MINNRFLIIGLVLIIFLSRVESPARAAADEYYREILSANFSLNISGPPSVEVPLVLKNPDGLFHFRKDGIKELRSPIDFVLDSPVDYLHFELSIVSPYVSGSLRIQRNGFEVYSTKIMTADFYVNQRLIEGRYLIEFDGLDPFLDTSLFGSLKAYRYQTGTADYDKSDYVLFLASQTPFLGRGFSAVARSRPAIIVCDTAEEISFFNNSCSFSAIKSSPRDLILISGPSRENWMVIPYLNQEVLLVTPQVFTTRESVESLRDHLSKENKNSAKKSFWSNDFGGELLDIYQSLIGNVWVWYVFLILIILVAWPNFNRFSFKLNNQLTTRILLWQLGKKVLALIASKRPILLFLFSLSVLAFALVYFSKNFIFLIKDEPKVSVFSSALKKGLALDVSFVSLRHFLEVLFLNFSALFLILSFMDKIFPPMAGYLKNSLLVSDKDRSLFQKSIVIGLVLLLFLEAFNIVPQMVLPLITLLFFMLFINELNNVFSQKTASAVIKPFWYYLGLLLFLVFWLSPWVRQGVFGKEIISLKKEYAVGLGEGKKQTALPLPFTVKIPSKFKQFESLPVSVPKTFFANDYLIAYPESRRIDYLGNPRDLGRYAGKKVAIYLKGQEDRAVDPDSVFKYLGNFVSPETFKSGNQQTTLVEFPQNFAEGRNSFIFYTYFYQGENYLEINYLDLNLSPNPRTYFVNLYDAGGNYLLTAREKNDEFYTVRTPSAKMVKQKLAIPRDGIYVLELFFDPDVGTLNLNASAFLKSLRLQSDAVYYLSPEAAFVYRKSYAPSGPSFRFATANPFIFDLQSFGLPVDYVLVLNSGISLSFSMSNNEIDLGHSLNVLSKFYGHKGDFKVHSPQGGGWLIIHD